jgi:hypothetical protein
MNKLFIVLILSGLQLIGHAQSFNNDKTALINFVKRMYKVSPFEGAKLIEDADTKNYLAAISVPNDMANPIEAASQKALEAAKTTFAEPCVKFEMLEGIPNESKKTTTYLFSCMPLREFVLGIYKKAPFSGTRIIAAPKTRYVISVVAVSIKANANTSINDRLAGIKAKQQTSALFNGSTISSDIVIATDSKNGTTNSTEIIKEQTMGFAEGLELLEKFQDGEQLIYIFYREL